MLLPWKSPRSARRYTHPPLFAVARPARDSYERPRVFLNSEFLTRRAPVARRRLSLPPRLSHNQNSDRMYVIFLLLAGFQPTSWQVFSQLWISLRIFLILYRMFPHFFPALALTSFFTRITPPRPTPPIPSPASSRSSSHFTSPEAQASSPLKSQYSQSTGVIRVKEKAA